MKRSFYLRFLAPVLALLPIALFSQSAVSDSLKKILAVTKTDTTKAVLLNRISFEYRNGSPDSAEFYCRQALALATAAKYDKEIARSLNSLGVLNMYRGNYDTAIVYYNKSLDFKKNDKAFRSTAFLSIGNTYQKMGKYKEGLGYYVNAIKLREELKDTSGIAVVHNAIGNMYYLQQNLDKAEEEYRVAMQLGKLKHDKKILSDCLNNLGIIYSARGDQVTSLHFFISACNIRKELGMRSAVARSMGNIGSIYTSLGKNDSALYYLDGSMKAFEEMGDREAVAMVAINMGELYAKTNNYTMAEQYYQRSVSLSKEIGSTENLMSSYEGLANLFAKKNDFKNAFEYHKLYASLHDTLINQDNLKQVNEMQAKYESEKQAQQIISLEKDKKLGQLDLEKKESDIRRQNIILGCGAAGFFLLLLLAFFIYRGYREKKRSNVALQSAYNTIEEKNVIVEEKNKEILDSIHYAKRIQQALFASEATIKADYPDHFVLYKPKDIVSGDFYWAYRAVTKNNERKFLLCAGDCTGHGVPGAFMSLLGISFLNQIVSEKKVIHPHLAFNLLRDEITKALNPEEHSKNESSKEGSVQDGMDAVLCCFDPENMAVSFACANNPLWLIRNGKDTVEEFKPDKFPLGKYHGDTKSFRLQSTLLQKGDTIYLFTDGYADQFGGPEGKKFKYKKLENLLLSIQAKDLREQKTILADTIENWKGNLEQVDDILIVGIRV